jgi:hypothetical protein
VSVGMATWLSRWKMAPEREPDAPCAATGGRGNVLGIRPYLVSAFPLPSTLRIAARLLAAAVSCGPAAAAESLRVSLIAPGEFPAPLRAALERDTGLRGTAVAPVAAGGAAGRLDGLATADVVLVFRGPGVLDPADRARLRDFLQGGRGAVVLGAAAEAWPASADLLAEMLGAVAGGAFAGGAPLTVINLFPHPILSGVEHLDTREPVVSFGQLADDVQMIIEGTVGEATAPLAWVRRSPARRFCHVVLAGDDVAGTAVYQRLVANAVRWAGNRPIPGARPVVQRTFMPEAHPGSFALTFPGGPSVCLDPVRGGINYIWDSDFVDLRPRWITKQGAPARLFGAAFYAEKAWQPLRAGSPDDPGPLRFRGYTLKAGAPEFHYQVGGRDVFETITALEGGEGVVRTFRVGPGARPLWVNFEDQPGASVSTRGLERDGRAGTFAASAGGEFQIVIRRRIGGVIR